MSFYATQLTDSLLETTEFNIGQAFFLNAHTHTHSYIRPSFFLFLFEFYSATHGNLRRMVLLCQAISARVNFLWLFCSTCGSSKSLFGLVILERTYVGLGSFYFKRKLLLHSIFLHTTNDGACPEEEEAEPGRNFFQAVLA